MSAVLAATPARWGGLRAAVPALLLGLALLGLLFRAEAAAAVAVWDSSTAYNHCILVLPIAAWLAFERRARLPGLPIRPLPAAALLALPLGVFWLLSERLGIMEGRQFAALGCAELLVLTVLGWQLVRALAAPLAYLVFLVPFGAFLTGPLQGFTAGFVVWGLGLLGIPNYSDGYTIEIPEGVFFVAEACAGLRFLIAAVAFGVLYAFTMYRSPLRRVLFVAASTVVPVLANGVRALGIVVAGHWVGSAQAAAADHLIYGWLFFSLVIALLIVAGLPFRQDGRAANDVMARGAPADGGRPALLRLASPALLLAALASAGPLLAGALDRAASSSPAAAAAALPGCVPEGTPAPADATGAAEQDFRCQDGALRVLAVAFPPRTNPMVILAAQRRLTGQAAEDVEITAAPNGDAPGWAIVTTRQPDRVSATALWIDGLPAGSGLASRVRQARNSVLGAARPVVLAVASAPGPLGPALRAANAAGLSAQLAAASPLAATLPATAP